MKCPFCGEELHWTTGPGDGMIQLLELVELPTPSRTNEGLHVSSAEMVKVLVPHVCEDETPAVEELSADDKRELWWVRVSKLAVGYDCPVCGVLVGQDCVHATRGTPINWPHKDRIRLLGDDHPMVVEGDANNYMGRLYRK